MMHYGIISRGHIIVVIGMIIHVNTIGGTTRGDKTQGEEDSCVNTTHVDLFHCVNITASPGEAPLNSDRSN